MHAISTSVLQLNTKERGVICFPSDTCIWHVRYIYAEGPWDWTIRSEASHNHLSLSDVFQVKIIYFYYPVFIIISKLSNWYDTS